MKHYLHFLRFWLRYMYLIRYECYVMVTEKAPLFRPYSPPANMQAFLHRIRRMNIPPRVTREILKGIGISENIIPRVLSTLRFLELITDKHEPTDILRGLAGSTEDEYRQLLERTIRNAYADDFTIIDPGKDPQEVIMNAFQKYTPRSQHARQVMLFLGLCREAGLATLDVPRRREMRSSTQGRKAVRGSAAQRTTQQPADGGAPSSNGAAAMREALPEPTQFLGLSLEDAAFMREDDFWEVWNALGTVFLRRAQRIYATPQQEYADSQEQTENEGF